MTPERFAEQSTQMIGQKGAFKQIGGNAVIDPPDGLQAALYQVDGERVRFLHVADTDPASDNFQETIVPLTQIDLTHNMQEIIITNPNTPMLQAQNLGSITLRLTYSEL